MRRGFSLVELVVVIAVMAVLLAVLLPAVQAAREASRRASCSNNLRQIAVAALLHEQSHRHFPYGGWGHAWVGVASRGFNAGQPGGWIFNLLDYAELSHLRNVEGIDLANVITTRIETPLELFNCPSRRTLSAWPVSESYPHARHPKPAGDPIVAGRSDYAINAGATLLFSEPGPPDFATADSLSYHWPEQDNPQNFPQFEFSGISHYRRAARVQSIVDGLSATYLVGEKLLAPLHYEDGEASGDNESLYTGYSTDNYRFTRLDLPPLNDNDAMSGNLPDHRFGSAHSAGVIFAFCDGSVRLVGVDIDPLVHFRNGHTADEGVIIIE